jgi:hypothetical protein
VLGGIEREYFVWSGGCIKEAGVVEAPIAETSEADIYMLQVA